MRVPFFVLALLLVPIAAIAQDAGAAAQLPSVDESLAAGKQAVEVFKGCGGVGDAFLGAALALLSLSGAAKLGAKLTKK